MGGGLFIVVGFGFVTNLQIDPLLLFCYTLICI